MSAGANKSGVNQCRVCAMAVAPAFTHQLLGKYSVQYFTCSGCGLLQTEAPYWLDEAYGQPIAERDTGVVARNLHLANVTAALAWHLNSSEARCLDAAGGYGLFTRLMRDIGFDYYWSDPHTPNLLARGFEAQTTSQSFELVSAFEVLEHLADPVGFLSNLRNRTGCHTFITSTELYSGPPPDPDWWYYVFDTGQHIGFYQRRTLQVIATQLGMQLHSRRNIHVFTDRPLSALRFRLITSTRWAALMASLPKLRLRSRVWADSQQVAAGTLTRE